MTDSDNDGACAGLESVIKIEPEELQTITGNQIPRDTTNNKLRRKAGM